jgi:hypothetical protein
MDVVGGVLLVDATGCKIPADIDDHSRVMICAGIMVRATVRPVCGFFAEALERHGASEEILTDIQGKAFTNGLGRRQTDVLFYKVCRENGTPHRLTASNSVLRFMVRTTFTPGSRSIWAVSDGPGPPFATEL